MCMMQHLYFADTFESDILEARFRPTLLNVLISKGTIMRYICKNKYI